MKTGIFSAEIARELAVSRPTVHSMMEQLIKRQYIYKEPQGLVYLTKRGMRVATVYELYYYKLKERLFSDRRIDATGEAAICALLGELSEENLLILAREMELPLTIQANS